VARWRVVLSLDVVRGIVPNLCHHRGGVPNRQAQRLGPVCALMFLARALGPQERRAARVHGAPPPCHVVFTGTLAFEAHTAVLRGTSREPSAVRDLMEGTVRLEDLKFSRLCAG